MNFVKKHRSRKTVCTISLCVCVFIICTFIIIYFSRVQFYNPLKIRITDSSGAAYTNYNLCGITPLGKVYFLSEDYSNKSFSTLGHAVFFRKLFIVFPANFADTGLTVHVTHGKHVFTSDIKELLPPDNVYLCSKSGPCFLINNPQSTDIFTKMKAVMLWQKETLFLIIGLVAILLTVVIVIIVAFSFRWPTLSGKSKYFLKQKLTDKAIVLIFLTISLLLSVLYFKSHFINSRTYSLSALLTLYGIVAMGFILIAYLLSLIFRQRTLVIKFLVLSSSLLFVVVIAEALLRSLGINATYFEKTYGTMNSGIYTNSINSQRLLRFRPCSEIKHSYKEFSYYRKISKDGFIDSLPDKPKTIHEKRVLALGDSYTEGVGAPADSAWPSLLGNFLKANADSITYTVFNAGVSGSDPVLEYLLLTEYFSGYNPDMVVVTLNESDISDFIVRGGPERIVPGDTVVHNRKGPCWEWLYNISYVARLIAINGLGYSPLLIKNKNMPGETDSAIEKLFNTLKLFNDYCTIHNMKLLVVFIPSPHELQYSHTYSFLALIERLKSDSMTIIDMYEVFMNKMAAKAGGLNTYYWPKDGHCTSSGYKVIAEQIGKALLKK